MLSLPAWADEWIVNRVRGDAQFLSGGQWAELTRGLAIVDGSSVRTGDDGRVGLARGAETIELAPGTEVFLHEGEGKLTSIEQKSGSIDVDVERRNVQHFSVQTPYLAAVVKGTKFTVRVGRGSASVVVERGTVQVQDTINNLVVDIVRGQQAEVSKSAPLLVSGSGPIAVFTFEGAHVVNGTANVPADNAGQAASTTRSTQDTARSASPGSTAISTAAPNNATTNSAADGNDTSIGNSNAANAGNGNAGGNGNGNAGGNGNGNAGGNGNSNAGGNGN